MNPLACPSCSQPCLSVLRKLSLGPARSVACRACGCRVSVAWLSGAAMLLLATVAPFVIAALGAGWLAGRVGSVPFGTFAAAFVVLLLLSSLPFLWAYYRFVPLVARVV